MSGRSPFRPGSQPSVREEGVHAGIHVKMISQWECSS